MFVLVGGQIGSSLSIILAVVLYLDGLKSVLTALGVAVGLLLWSAAFLQTQRLIVTLIGLDTTMVIAAASVAFALLDLPLWAAICIAVGVFCAAVPGPRVPVTVGARSGLPGKSIEDELSHVRISLDPTLTALSLAIPPALFVGGHTPSAVTLVIGQVGAFLLIARARARTSRVVGLLAKLRLGSADTRPALRRRLIWGVVRSAALLTVLLGTSLVLANGDASVTWVALLQFSGTLLVAGVGTSTRALAMTGGAAATEAPQEEESVLSVLRRRLLAWRRSRYARLIGVVVSALVILRFISDWTGILQAAQACWGLVRELIDRLH
jgi:hypothetical protein